MSIVIGLLKAHLLSMIEIAIADEEPTIIAEIELLITKLQGYISGQSSPVSSSISPSVNKFGQNMPAVVNSAITAVQSPILASSDM